MTNFRKDPAFWDFEELYYEDIDRAIHSMYLQWKEAVEQGKIVRFKLPEPETVEDPPEDFKVEVIDKAQGAGVIRTTTEGDIQEIIIWRINNEGHAECAPLTKDRSSPAKPLDKPVQQACEAIVSQFFEGKQIEVNEKFRDHYYYLHTGIK